MAANDPTRLQRIASDPAHSVWVSASAGSGKTKVLTDRVLRLLLGGTPPSRILCITYTKAAAAEMYNRIHHKLGAWVSMEPATLHDTLKELTGAPPTDTMITRAQRLFAELLEAMPGLRIQTFHSFCQSLLARFPLEAGIAPHFTLIDEADGKALMEEAWQRLLSSGLSGEDERLQWAIEYINAQGGEWGFSALVDEIIGNRRQIEQCVRQPGGIDDMISRTYTLFDLKYGVDEDVLIETRLGMNTEKQARLEHVADVLREGSKQDVTLADALAYYLMSGDINDLFAALLTQKGTVRSRLMTKGLVESYPDHYDFLVQMANECLTCMEALNSLQVAQFSEAVMIMAEALFALYAGLKQHHLYLDYDDLIVHTRCLLSGTNMVPWVLYKLDGGIDHVLIDEAQDTSPEQWQLKEVLEQEFFAGEGQIEGDTRTLLWVTRNSPYTVFRGQIRKGFRCSRRAVPVLQMARANHLRMLR